MAEKESISKLAAAPKDKANPNPEANVKFGSVDVPSDNKPDADEIKEAVEPPQENMVKVKFNRCWGSGKYYEADGKEISFKDALAKYGNSAINLHKIYKEGEVAWLPENIAAHLMNDHVETYNPTPGVLNKSQVAAGVAELPKVSTAQRVKSKE